MFLEIYLGETLEMQVSQYSRNIHHIPPKPPVQTPRPSISDTQTGLKSSSSKLEAAISSEREVIAKDLEGYQTTTGESVENYFMEEGGNPVRAMVVTIWRSGSTFLGDIITSHPATFYHYEPLLHFDIVQARGGDNQNTD